MSGPVLVGTPVVASVTNAGSISASYPSATAGNCLVATLSVLQASGTAQPVLTPTDTNNTPSAWAPSGGSQPLALDTLSTIRYGVMGGYQLNCNAGAHTIGFTFPNGVTYGELTISEWSNVATVSAEDALGQSHIEQQGAGITTLTAPNTSTLAQADEVAIAVMCAFSQTGAANAAISDPPAGWQKIAVQQSTVTTVGSQTSYKIVSATTPVGVAWSWTDSSIEASAGLIFTLKAAASPAASLDDSDWLPMEPQTNPLVVSAW